MATAIVMDPSSLAFSYLGETHPLSISVQDQEDRPMESSVDWISQDETVASIDAAGRVTAVGPGSTSVLIEAGAVSATVPVVVAQVPATIALEPDSAVLRAEGETLRLTALVLDAGGSEIARPDVAWETEADAVATVDETGLVRGVGAGATGIRARAGGVSSEARLWVHGSELNLVVEGLHLNQGNQSDTYAVPAIAGRAGALRVFVSANGQADVSPDVLVRLYRDGQLFRESLVPGVTGVVGSPVPDDPSLTWNLPLAAEEVVAGLEVEVVVDPANSVPEADEADNVFPSSGGRYAIDVVDPGPLDVLFVPILALDRQEDARIDPSNLETFLSEARLLLPVGGINARIREPMLTDRTPVTVEEWQALLADLQALRTAEQPSSSPTYYHGIVNVEGVGPEISGLGYMPASPGSVYRSAVSWDRPYGAARTVAHELGHNLGRPHAPCGSPDDPDLEYPYPDGTIGRYGYRADWDSWMQPSRHDFMSYCAFTWISDYTFSRIVEWRLADPAAGPSSAATVGAASADRTPGLLAWGRIGSEGVELNPLIELEAPLPPPSRGDHVIVGYADDGAELFRVAFRATSVADVSGGGEHFAVFIPLAESEQQRVARVEVTSRSGRVARMARAAPGPASAPGVSLPPAGAGDGTLRWDPSRFPMMVLKDRVTGQVRGIFRRGSVRLPPGLLDRVDVSLSDGVRTQRVQ